MFRILFVVRGPIVHVVAVRHPSQRSLTEEMEDDDFETLH
jgi:hypothetical protein